MLPPGFDDLADRLARPGFALQIVGEPGRGKSTLLHALMARLPAAAYVYLAEGMPTPQLPAGSPLLVDEAQRLPDRARAALFRRGTSLALATHVDLSAELARAGLAHATVPVGGISPERLDAIVRRRFDWARRGPGSVPTVPTATLAGLIARHGDDLRAILAELYDACQRLSEVGDVRL